MVGFSVGKCGEYNLKSVSSINQQQLEMNVTKQTHIKYVCIFYCTDS